MPFKVKKSGSGYKVFSPNGAKSKRPMSKAKARKQQAAIYANWKGESFDRKLDAALGLISENGAMMHLAPGMEMPNADWDEYPPDQFKVVSQSFDHDGDTLVGEIIAKVGPQAAAAIQRWIVERPETGLPDDIRDVAHNIVQMDFPGISVRKWGHKLEGDKLTMWPEDTDDSRWDPEDPVNYPEKYVWGDV